MNKVVRKILRAVIAALAVTGLVSLVLPFAGAGIERQAVLFATFMALTITLMVLGLPAADSKRPPAE